MKRASLLLAAGAALSLSCAGANAQNFPSKPITILFSTAPGGSLDVMSRVAAAHFEKKWGVTATVEARPGGGGIVAGSQAVRAPADGHVLLVSGSPQTVTVFVKDIPFDAFKDLTGVSLIGLLAYQLQVSRSMNVKTLKEFVAYAKANPGKVTLGAVAPGTHELEIHSLQQALGFTGSVIPFKGIAPIWLELIANRLDATLSASTPPQQKTGEILAIAVGGDRRNPNFPEVSTFREQGMQHDPVASYYMLANAATPRPVLDQISAAMAEVAKGADFEAKVTKTINIVGVGASLDETNRYMRNEYERLKKVAGIAKIMPQ
jgi:tripartite-type tricarboxylate transporter receptor subunit TctC